MDSIGDLARALVLRTNQVQLREEMDQLAVEIATGFVKDPAQHLGGDLTGLLSIDRSLATLEIYRVNTTEATFITSTMQTTLDEIQTRTETVSQVLIAAELTPNQPLLNTFSDNAEDALGMVLNGLNRTVAGRFLFSGVATDRPAVQGLEDLMAEVQTELLALPSPTTLADIEAALDTFFGPGGTYETVTYEGANTGLAPLQLSETDSASVDIRATDPSFRALLRPLVMAAAASEPSLGFSTDLQVDLLRKSGEDLLAAQQDIVELRAGLGALEARVQETSTRNAAERTATQLVRLDLVGTDQYETASRYENIRSQLESLYAITARSQRLSLAEYL